MAAVCHFQPFRLSYWKKMIEIDTPFVFPEHNNLLFAASISLQSTALTLRTINQIGMLTQHHAQGDISIQLCFSSIKAGNT